MPTSSHLRETIASLEQRRAALDDAIRGAQEEREEIDAVLDCLKAVPAKQASGRRSPRRDEAKEIRALVTASPNGLNPSEIADRGGLSLPTVQAVLEEMVARGELRLEKGRYVSRSVVPGAEAATRTKGGQGPTPDVARN